MGQASLVSAGVLRCLRWSVGASCSRTTSSTCLTARCLMRWWRLVHTWPVIQPARPGSFTRPQHEGSQGECGNTLRLVYCWFRCILLPKQIRRQDSGDKEVDSTSSWAELESHITKRMHRNRWITRYFLAITSLNGLLISQSLEACLSLGILNTGGKAQRLYFNNF